MEREINQAPKEGFDQSRKEQLKKYKIPEHPQGREAVEKAVDNYAERAWGDVAIRMFRVENPDVDLDEEEKADIKHFIRRAGKRLTVDTFHSPLFALPEDTSPEKAINSGLFAHDLTHTIPAFDRSGGQDMTPEFMKSEGEAQYTDPDILEEEVFANLWGETQFGNILLVASGENVEGSLRDIQDAADGTKYDQTTDEAAKERFRQKCNEMKETILNADRSDAEKILDTYETLMGNVLQIQLLGTDSNASEEKLAAIMDTVRAVRPNGNFPEYTIVAKNIIENHGTDKKIHFKEMQRILEPVLERERTKERYAQEDTTSHSEDKDRVAQLRAELKEEI